MQIGMMLKDRESAQKMARGHFRLAGTHIEEE